MNYGDSRLPDRFWDKVQPCPMSGCWLWTAHTVRGYGQARINNVRGYAHRLAYEAVSPIPYGLVLDHLCRVSLCVNPSHLEPVTVQENVRRGVAGIVGGARNRAKTACPHGHPYSGSNLYVRPRGYRECRACRPQQQARAIARRKSI